MGVHDRHPGPAQAPTGQPEEARLRLLEAAGEGLSDAELLRLALDHLVAGLAGLGGMAHLRGQDGLGLRLVATSGLTGPLVHAWQSIRWGEPVAPMSAFQDSVPVWASQPAIGDGSLARTGPPDLCMTSVPVPMDDGPAIGVLSVLTATPRTGDTAQRELARTVTRWAAGRLPGSWAAPAGATGDGPTRPPEGRGPGPTLEGALRTARMGAWAWDLRTSSLTCDDQAQSVLGFAPGTFDGQVTTWLGAIHPEDLPWVEAVSCPEALRDRGVYSVEYRVRQPDGAYRWVQARGAVVSQEGGVPARMVGTVWDTTGTRNARDSLGHALQYLGDGFLVVDAEGRITFANVEAEHFLKASGDLLGQVLWELPRARAIGVEPRFRRAASARAPIDFHARRPSSDRWYHLRLVPVPEGMAILITDVTDRRALDAERSAAAHAATERATRIAELTSALAETLTVREVVKVVADRVLPPFGATGLVCQLIDNERLRLVGASGYSEGFLTYLQNIPVPRFSPVVQVLESRIPIFISSPEDYAGRFPDVVGYLPLSGKKAWAFLPLVASDQQAGYCVVSFDRPRHFTEEERTLLTALSGLVAQALERARLYDAEHTRAQELQRGLLPRTLPALPAITAAARYLPAGEGMEVGGDWYDLIPLSGERVALVIGDVMGHGLSEAATMGRLRTAVHTLADLELPPDELLTHLNDLVGALGDDFYATCLYAVYDPTTSRCAFACAGHPPPAIIHPDGTVHSPGFSPDPPLGAATPPFETIEVHLPKDSILVLCTDGLIESATRDIDRGMAYLARTLTRALATTPGLLARLTAGDRDPRPADRSDAKVLDDLNQLCDTLVAALLPEQSQTQDDAALLVARTHSTTPDNLASWPLPDDPIAAGEARGLVRDQLGAWQLDELAMTTELLVSELVGNVVRHAKGPIQLRLLRSRSLLCEVSDGSPTTPRIRRASDTDEGGRGLQLVAALSHRWGTRFTPTGKCIWAEQPLPTY